VFILAPLDPGGIVIARGGDELLRPDGPSIQAQRAEAKGGGEVLGEEAASPLLTS